MQKKFQFYLWLALLAHLLLFLSVSLSLLNETEKAFEKKSDQYLPAYLYQQETLPTHEAKNAPQSTSGGKPEPESSVLPEAIAVKKQKAPQQDILQNTTQRSKSSNPQTLGSSAFIQAESPTTGKPKDEPLLKELSRATAAKLSYPPEAAAFKLKGKTVVRFLLSPDGTITEITLAQSSGFRILDNAALATIRSISPVRDANLYLTKPKMILAGIIFG